MDSRIIFVIIILVLFAVVSAISLIKMPKEQKIANIKEWLKWAVSEAEKELGSGTGQLKLRKVYSMALIQFPELAKLVPFETFSSWVDIALDWMNEQLQKNKNIQSYIEKTE